MSLRLILIAPLLFCAATASAETQLLWGDTHVHTYYSPDAYLNQNFTAGPDTAYRFARGLPVVHPYTRTRVQLETPLDFLVVADHAESMGVFRRVAEEGVPIDGLGFLERIQAWAIELGMSYLVGNPDSITMLLEYATAETNDVVESARTPPKLPIPNTALIQHETWLESTAFAEDYNDPGEFTALIGWEWSSIPAGANLHSSSRSNYPEDLWRFLERTSTATGADFISIPHNSNISRGFMFPTENRLRGTAIDDEWLNLRARFENVVEATQIKGDSETDPALSPDDPFADFESFPYYLKPSAPDFSPGVGDFVRSGLRTGLAIEARLGTNPYRFGLIGSTDSHTGLATAEEANFWGKMASDSTPESKTNKTGHIDKLGWTMSASGLAGVWAEENNRESIFAAFKRREVYATTGPRIAVRVYAGTEFVPGDEDTTDMAATGASGVPMGGELNALESAPSFLIQASKDPVSAHLDRVQMVKGWLDGDETYEKVFDVAWAGDRQPGADGLVPAVPDTVNPADGSYSNEHGVATLAALWTDPDFDPAQAAFYYVRVLEVPTPRHSTLDAIALQVDVAETEQSVSIQERAYTSPIFYSP
jgi:hypothetical protein